MSVEKSEDYGLLQRVVDSLFESQEEIKRMDLILLADSFDLPKDLQEIVNLLPPGVYTRQQLCIQLNSAISGHGWGYVYGTVE